MADVCTGALGAVFEVVSVLQPIKNAQTNVAHNNIKCEVFMHAV